MKLVNGYDLMKYAQARKLVLPAFNTTNMEMTFAITKGLNDAQLPGYIQISSNNLRLSDPETIVFLARKAAKKYDTPIGLHLDHGKSYDDVKACVDAGFTSIMIDASHLPFEENVAAVKKAVQYCHFYGIPVEAELGAIGGKEDDTVNESDCKTNPDMVLDFVERTGCDTLAVAVGNVHGLESKPNIDIPLLETLAKISPVPLVLHGGSGIPFDVILEAVKHNLIKINYGADLRRAFITTFGQAYEKNNMETNVIEFSLAGVKNVATVAENLVKRINGILA